MCAAKPKAFDPQVIATTLMGCVEETFTTMCSLTFSNTPEFKEKDIIEYNSKMQISGLEKFNDASYAAAINFYLTEAHQKKHDCCGVLAMFIEEDAAGKLLKALGYSGFNDEDEELVMDNCGEFCNVITGRFKDELAKLGYKNLIISAPVKGKNSIPGGVEFPYSQYKYYEANFYFWKKKSLVIDITMSPIPEAV